MGRRRGEGLLGGGQGRLPLHSPQSGALGPLLRGVVCGGAGTSKNKSKEECGRERTEWRQSPRGDKRGPDKGVQTRRADERSLGCPTGRACFSPFSGFMRPLSGQTHTVGGREQEKNGGTGPRLGCLGGGGRRGGRPAPLGPPRPGWWRGSRSVKRGCRCADVPTPRPRGDGEATMDDAKGPDGLRPCGALKGILLRR